MKVYIKFLSLFLIVAFMFIPVMTGCGGDKDIDDPEATEEEKKEEEPISHKVGFIYRGTVSNSTHNLIFEDARGQLERNLGVETCYVESVFISNFMQAVDMLVERDVTVIVSTCHSFKNIVERAAVANKDVNFIGFGGDVDSNRTLVNLTLFRPLLYQPAHISGLAASINTDAASFGIVADPNMYNHEGVINAYIIGAKDFLERNITAHVNYVSSDYEAGVRAAIDDLVRNGCDVIMLYLKTDYGIRYCEEIGVKVIAYSGNLPELAPNRYITGFYFNVNSYITEQVRFIQNEMFAPSTTYGSMATGHAKMIHLNPNEYVVIPETKQLIDMLYSRVLASDGVFTGQIVDNFGVTQVEHGFTLAYRDALSIRWLELSVGGNIDRFSTPVEEIPVVPLFVRGERQATAGSVQTAEPHEQEPSTDIQATEATEATVLTEAPVQTTQRPILGQE
jgi:basic membrane lipoprotein Med (substrate-binding protein (PBP1-ABC) superfamily)